MGAAPHPITRAGDAASILLLLRRRPTSPSTWLERERLDKNETQDHGLYTEKCRVLFVRTNRFPRSALERDCRFNY